METQKIERPAKALWLDDIKEMIKTSDGKDIELFAVRAGHRIYNIILDRITKFDWGSLDVRNTDPENTDPTLPHYPWSFSFKAYNLIEYRDDYENRNCYIFKDYWFAQAYLGFTKAK